MKFNIFELGIFSFNSYVYYLTHGFIASTRALSFLTYGYELLTRRFELVTCEFELATCGFELVTHEFGLVTRIYVFTMFQQLRLFNYMNHNSLQGTFGVYRN